MTDSFVDPGEPGPLTSGMKAKDLLNKPLLLRVGDLCTDGKGTDDDGNPKAYDYYPCDVWVLDRAGIVESGTGVHFSWTRTMDQFADKVGQFIAATPRRSDNNSVILEAFTPEGKEVARAAIVEILGGREEAPPAEEEFSEEPF